MIQQLVRCDAVCDTWQVMFDDLPDHWVKHEGRHYCSPACFITDMRDSE